MTVTALNRFIVLVLTGSLVLLAGCLAWLQLAGAGCPRALLQELKEATTTVLAVLAAPATALALIVGLLVDGLAAVALRRWITWDLTRTTAKPSLVRWLGCSRDWLQYQFFFEAYYTQMQRSAGPLGGWVSEAEKIAAGSFAEGRADEPRVTSNGSANSGHAGDRERPQGADPSSSQGSETNPALCRVLARSWAAACFMTRADKRDSVMVSNHWMLYISATDLTIALGLVAPLLVVLGTGVGKDNPATEPAACRGLLPTGDLWAWVAAGTLVTGATWLLMRNAVVHYMYAYELVFRHCLVDTSVSRCHLPQR